MDKKYILSLEFDHFTAKEGDIEKFQEVPT